MSNYFLGKEASIEEKYPKIKNLECFSSKSEHGKGYQASDWKAICKYVVYRVDRDSPASQMSDETQAMDMAMKKAYLDKDIRYLIENEDDEILFIHNMTVEFLMLVKDYKMQELISIRGILRKIMLSSISPTMEMREGTKHDASHHQTMVKSLKDFPALAERAESLEEEIFGLLPEEGENKGKMWGVAGASERRAKTELYPS